MSGAAPSGADTADAVVGAREAPAPRSRWRSWGAAAGLAVVVVVLGVADGFALLVLPLAVLLLGFAGRQSGWWLGLAVVVWGLALVPGGSALHMLSRGWALVLGGSFLAITLLRPRWCVFSRALAGVAAAAALTGAWLGIGGDWPAFDRSMAQHFDALAILTSREVLARFPDTAWASQVAAMAGQMSRAQGVLFPSLLALQSLAALALAWWMFARRGARPALRPLREFRFNDALVWAAIGGVLLLLLPLGDGAARLGYNLLFFMSALYALRGFAVFVFLARGAPSMVPVVLGVVAAVFFYPLVFTAALLVGLGDTWLDVRGRVLEAAARA